MGAISLTLEMTSEDINLEDNNERTILLSNLYISLRYYGFKSKGIFQLVTTIDKYFTSLTPLLPLAKTAEIIITTAIKDLEEDIKKIKL
jgi:hypothetical protein